MLLQLVFSISGAILPKTEDLTNKIGGLVLRAWYGANIVWHEGKYSVDSQDLQDEQDSIPFILKILEVLSKAVLRGHLRRSLAADK